MRRLGADYFPYGDHLSLYRAKQPKYRLVPVLLPATLERAFNELPDLRESGYPRNALEYLPRPQSYLSRGRFRLNYLQ